uniref:Uncharacterized protein n=1 Tax=Rhizophora mucronata TaxID=61149 RepID=A0A2P2R1J3_RHIMU
MLYLGCRLRLNNYWRLIPATLVQDYST